MTDGFVCPTWKSAIGGSYGYQRWLKQCILNCTLKLQEARALEPIVRGAGVQRLDQRDVGSKGVCTT